MSMDDLARAEQSDPCCELAHLVRNRMLSLRAALIETARGIDRSISEARDTMEGLQTMMDNARARAGLMLIDAAGSYEIRSDGAGDGAFGASRVSGSGRYGHRGVDTMVVPGTSVRAPVSGRVARLGYCYAGEPYRLVIIGVSDWEVRVLYALCPEDLVGRMVRIGQHIGIAQDVSQRNSYAAMGMLPHLHTEIRHAGELVDPTPLIFGG